MNYFEPESLQQLKNSLKLLPGVGEKTAERYAFSILNLEEQKVNDFSKNLLEIKKNISTCPNCGCLCEKNNCSICQDKSRENGKLCVLENQRNVFLFEKNKIFNGKYHVLGGLISPMEGINPENLLIDKLVSRIDKENITEIILALRPGIEGETTSLYIKKILESKNVKISQIAQGIPIGTDMEYLDDLTIELALSNRKDIS